MKSKQSIGRFLLPPVRAQYARYDWKPVHPFLRCVSACLSVVLAFTFGGPVQQAFGAIVTSGTLSATNDGDVLQINATNGSIIIAGSLESGSDLAKRSAFALTISGSLFDGQFTSLTLGSGSTNAVVGKLSFSDAVRAGNVSAFDNTSISVDPVKIGTLIGTLTLGSGGLSLPYGGTLSFGKWTSGVGGAQVKVVLGGSQTWTIGGGTSKTQTYTTVAGFYDVDADAYGAARVENSNSEAKTLTISTSSPETSDVYSAVFLDVGKDINLSKTGSRGVLHLNRNPLSDIAFTGTITISGGEVELADGFLQVSGGNKPTVNFKVAAYDSDGLLFLPNAFPTLRVVGTNSVVNIIENIPSASDPLDASNNYVPSIVGPLIGSTTGGTLILELGAANLTLQSHIREDDSYAPLALIKRGSGVFTPLNNTNSFSGGLTIEGGTLAVTQGAAVDALGDPIYDESFKRLSAIGVGPLILSGGTAGATLLFGTLNVTSGTLSNDVVLRGSSDLSKKAKVVIAGAVHGVMQLDPASTDQEPSYIPLLPLTTSLTLTGLVKVEGFDPLALVDSGSFVVTPANVELSLLTPLTLDSDLESSTGSSGLVVVGTLSLTGGSSLTLSSGLSELQLGDFILQNGTLSLGRDANQSGISINGTTGSRRIQLMGQDVLIESGDSIALPVWESAFSFSGGDKTLEIVGFTDSFGMTRSAVAIRSLVSVNVEDGTLSLGGVQKASGADTGVLSKTGLGTLEFKAGIVSGGSLGLTGLQLLGGPVVFSSTSPLAFEGTVALSGSTVEIVYGGSVSLSGGVSGTGFTKAGLGALAFTGANTISGTSTLRAGSLSLASGTGAVFLGDGQTAPGDAAPVLFTTGTVSSPITVGSGATSAYTATLASSGTAGISTFSGAITLSAGSASLALQAATGGTLNISGAWTANAKPITVGALGKLGTVKLSSVLSTAGGLSVSSGTLLVGTANALGSSPLSLNGGSLDLSSLNTTAGAVTMTSGNIFGTGALSATSLTAQSGSIYASLAGSGSFTKSTAGNVTLLGANSYTGATTVQQGTLTSGLPPSTSAISIASGATYKLALTASGTYSGTLNNDGTLLLTSTLPVVLTLGNAARLSGSIQVGTNVTLKAASDANNLLFSTGFTLSLLSGGSFNANGTTLSISTITLTGTGTLFSSSGTAHITSTTPLTDIPNVDFGAVRRTNQTSGQPATNPLKLYFGKLGNLASGSSFSQVITESDRNLATLSFDQAVVATTSVVARVSGGSLYTLSIEAPVTTPLLDIQSGVSAVFTPTGSLSGTLQIEGSVSLSGATQSFSAIRLNDGTLSSGTLSGGSVVDSGGSVSVLSANLAPGFGSITKTGLGTLTISGANTAYTGSLYAGAGTVALGSSSALGTTVRIGSLASGATLRLSANNVNLAALTGSGVIENASAQPAVVTLNTASDSSFGGVFRNGTGNGTLSLVKDGATTVTLSGNSIYTGTTTVRLGKLQLSGGQLPTNTAVDVQGGILALGGTSLSVGSYSQSAGTLENGTVTLLSPASFLLSGGSISATLAGTAAANVTGNVTLNIAAAYTGATAITSGKLLLAGAGALPSSTSLSIVSGTFALGGTSQTVGAYTQTGGSVENGTVTLNSGSFNLKGGSVSATLAGGAGAFVDGTVTLNTAANYGGNTLINSGKLQLASAILLPSATVLTLQGGVLALGDNNQPVGAYTQRSGIVENGILTLNSGSFSLQGGTVDAVLTGLAGMTVTGSVNLNRTATYTGATLIQSGRLLLAGSGALSNGAALTVQGGTLNLGGKTQQAGAVTIAGGLTEAGVLNGTSYTLGGGGIVSAILAGTGPVSVTGAATLSGANTFTGDTTLATLGSLTVGTATALANTRVVYSAGALVFAGGISEATFGGLTGSQNLALSNATAGPLQLTVNSRSADTYAGVLSGLGGLQKTGSGTLELTGRNTFSGKTTVSQGLLRSGTSLLSTSEINVVGGSFETTSYNRAALLKVAAGATAFFPENGTFTIGTIANSGRLNFGGTLSDFTIDSLTGSGLATFANDATITGGIGAGTVQVAGDLVTASVSDGVVTAARIQGLTSSGVNINGGSISINGTFESEVGQVSGGTLTFAGPVIVGTMTEGSLRATAEARFTSLTGGSVQLSGGTATLGAVSGGNLVLSTTQAQINGLNGGTVVNNSNLTVESGIMSGAISGTGSLTKSGALNLTLSGLTSYTGVTTVSGGTLFVAGAASLSNSAKVDVNSGAEARFSATTTLKEVSGSGLIRVEGDASVLAPVVLGNLSVKGAFSASALGVLNGSGPQVQAGVLNVGTLFSGTVEGGTGSSLTTLAGGQLRLTGGQNQITNLTAGSLTLASALVNISAGTFVGSLSGDGTLTKVGPATLQLTSVPDQSISFAVQGGSLVSLGNLLTGKRAVSVSQGASLSLSQVQGVYSGTLSGSGSTQLLGAGLSLGTTGSLDGALTLATDGFKLDLSSATTSAFGDNASLSFLTAGTLVLNGNQEIALGALTLANTLTIQTTGANGSKIFYDPSNKPTFLPSVGDTFTLAPGSTALNGVTITGGSVTFDALSQVVEIAAGTYRVTTGAAQLRSGAFISAQTLLLDPKNPATVLRLGGGTFTTGIVAGGSLNQGIVSLDGPVTAGSLTISSGVRFEFNQLGALTKPGGALPTAIANEGTLVFNVATGTLKSVANSLSGGGSLEKGDLGTLELSGANTRTGTTLLNAGVVQINHNNALGSGPVRFSGGALKYGAGVTADLSTQIGALAAGSNAVVDTGTGAVTYGSVISGLGGFQKSGQGKLVFAAAETFTGPLIVREGVVEVGNQTAGSLAAGTTEVADGATLRFLRNSAVQYAGLISGSGSVEQAGTGILTLAGNNASFSGNVNLKSGVLSMGATQALGTGTLAFQGGTLQVGAGVTGAEVAHIADLSRNDVARIDTNSQNLLVTAALRGEGGLIKSGEGTLTLAGDVSYTGNTSILSGTLEAGNLLSGGRSVAVSPGALLSLSAVNGSYSGTLSGTGRTNLAGTQLTLENRASLDGAINVFGGSFVLDLSAVAGNPFGANATLDFSGQGQLNLGAGQEVELNALTLSGPGALTINVAQGSNGAKIYYDTTPQFLQGLADTYTLQGGSALVGVSAVGGSVTFEVLSQGTYTSGGTSGGTYQATAGRVQLRGGSPIVADTLLLDPKTSKTTLRLGGGTFATGILAGGSLNQGIVSLEGPVTAGSLTISSGVRFEFNQLGALTKPGGALPTAIANEGTLVFNVATGTLKSVANSLSGGGSLEKGDLGTLELSGANTRTGTTLLNAGVVQINHNNALGSGPVRFSGGALKYGAGVTADLSTQIGALAAGSNAVVDTGTGAVTYGSVISGLGGFQKSGQGKLVFAAAETFTGPLIVREGVVEVGNQTAGSLAAGTTEVADGATLRFLRNSAVQYAGLISGSGSVEQAGTGILTLAGNNASFSGNVNLKSGVLSMGATQALGTGTLAFQGGTLQVGAGVTGAEVAHIADLSRNDVARIDTNSQNLLVTAALRGEGGLIKSGEGTLTLAGDVSYTGNTSILSGTLEAGNLLSGGRSVAVSPGALLSLSAVNGSYSGTLSGTGRTNLAGTQLTLENRASLDGAINVFGGSFVLDLSAVAGNPFGANATLDFSGQGQLNLGAGQEVELNALTLSGPGALTINVAQGSNGAKIYYDTTPQFLQGLADTYTLQGGSALVGVSAVGGSVTFEVLSQGTYTSGGTYQATAGRVQLRGGSLLVADTLLIDPKTAQTIVRLNGGSFTQGIVAGGSLNQGVVLVGGTVRTGTVAIKSNVLMKLAQTGSFAAAAGGAAPLLDNAGTLQFSVEEATLKSVGNAIQGGGSIEKIDGGTLVLTGLNTNYTGKTTLAGGILQVGNNSALGAGGSIAFKGGALKYGVGVTVDLSKRIEGIGADSAAIIDVGNNSVTYASALSGNGGLTKSGAGVLELAATETFKGSLSVAAGTVQVGSGTLGSLEASSISVADGSLVRFARSDAASYSGAIKGSGTFEQAGSGTLTLFGDGSEFTGSYVLSSGVLLLDGQNALSAGSISFNKGALKYGSASSALLDLSARIKPVATGVVAAIDTGSYTVSYAHSLTGGGSLTKSGAGVLTFSDGAANLLAGPTSVTAGTLQYVGSAALNAGGTINTLAGSTVELTSASTGTFSGRVQGAGSLLKDGVAALTLSQTQPVTGGVNVAGGSLILGLGASLQGGSINVASGATLNIASGALDVNSALSISGNLVVGNGTTFLKSVTLSGGTATLDPAAIVADGALILTEGTFTGTNSGPVQISQFQRSASGALVVGGSLSGQVSGLPSGTELNLTGNVRREPVKLVKSGTLSSLSARDGVDLRVDENLQVSGDVSVVGGSLAVAANRMLQSTSGNVLLSGSSVATLGAHGTLSAKSVSVIGSTLTLSGFSQVQADAFTIGTAGTVVLEDGNSLQKVKVVSVGSLSSGSLQIKAGTLELVVGQVLKGGGRIVGNVSVPKGSFVSPGNSPGTFTVDALTIAGTLTLERGREASDSVAVGGSLAFEPGAQILLVDYDRSLLAGTLGYKFTGATSGTAAVTVAVRLSAVSGTVGEGVDYVIGTSALYSGTLSSSGTIAVKRNTATEVVGATGNLAQVASAVDRRLKTLSAAPVFAVTDLDTIGTGATLPEAKLNLAQQLAALNPGAYAELAALSTQRTLNLHQGLVGHFSSIRANLTDAPEGAFNAWTTGYGASHKQDGNRSIGTAGFTASSWGDMFGVEQRIGSLLLGVTGAAGHSSATFANNPGRATTDSWHGGLYGSLDLDGLVIESGALFGATDTTARRTISATGLTTREGRVTLNGSEWVANLGIAKPIAASAALTLTPSIRVIAQGQSQSAASENDLSGLEVSLAKQKTTTLQHQAGLELRRKLNVGGLPAAASLQLDWIHNYNAKGRDLNMALAGDSSASFGYKGSDSGADAIHIGGAFEAALSERTTLRLGCEYQSQTSLSTVRGSVSIGYQF